MTNTRIILFSILIAILLAILVMWCADVLAHNDGNPAAHFKPYTEEDPCWNDTCKDSEYRGGHGHIDGYDDENENGRWDLGEENSWGYWTCDGYKHLVPETDCSEPKPQVEEQAPQVESQNSESTAGVLDRIVEEEPESDVDIEIPDSPELPIAPEIVSWEVQFYEGWNFVSFPVVPEGVETISNLYHNWPFFAAHNADIYTHIDNKWLLYSGTNDGIAGEIPLSAHLGLAVRLDWASWLGLRGVPLPNEGSIDLRPGVNLVGFPDLPHGVTRPSDLLSDVICAVIVTRRGEPYIIGRVGDPGDEPLERGQAVILIVTEPMTLHLSDKSRPRVDGTRSVPTTIQGWGAEKVAGTD